MLRLLFTASLALLLSACGEFTLDNPNGQGPDPLFNVSFRGGSNFPHANAADDVLLVEIDDTDIGEPSTIRIYIDGDKLLTLSRWGGQHSVEFPPAAWTPTTGEHIVRVEAHGMQRELTFRWN